MSITRMLWGVCSALLLGTVCTPGARAQLKPPYVEYAAKFTCGQESVDQPDDVVTGIYASSINIYNPQSTIAVEFLKKIVPAGREGLPFVKSFITKGVLRPEQADRVDCPFIRKALNLPSPAAYAEGFVVLEVPPQGTSIPMLEVIGKYTARPSNAGVSTQSVVGITGKSISR